ncbi:MAG: hypothetical protein FIB08_11025 [Candidatus Methanoperedens sp.]|nr:hypothetical protein [Candidatus Methanoperedens sp.]
MITFTNAEKRLVSDYNIPADAFLPLLLSLRTGGDWSYSSENIKTISVMDKTTIYDHKNKSGYSLEEIYLFINPVLKCGEGTVHRLEKCGDEEIRLLVRRPYRVKVVSERVIKATVNPFERQIKTEELHGKELTFDGSTAYDISHEIEHLEQKEIKGESLWGFKFI